MSPDEAVTVSPEIGPAASGPSKPLLVVAGPTASGKSGLAIALAQALRGSVINIDSVQLYQQVDIGSAKVLPADQGGVPHYGIDVVPPDQAVDAGFFTEQARQWVGDIRAAGQLPVVVAGTTMYFGGLMGYLDDLPSAQEAVRSRLEEQETELLYRRLSEVDPVRAGEVHPNDRKRIVRALEIAEVTGQPMSSLGGFRRAGAESALILVLWWPREELYQRIDERSAILVRDGLLRETRELEGRFGDRLAAFKAVGYAQARSVLRGEAPEAGLSAAVARATRQLAKRQLTFWWNEPRRRGWGISPPQTGLAQVDADSSALTGTGARRSRARGNPLREAQVLRFANREALQEGIVSALTALAARNSRVSEGTAREEDGDGRVVVWYLDPRGLVS